MGAGVDNVALAGTGVGATEGTGRREKDQRIHARTGLEERRQT